MLPNWLLKFLVDKITLAGKYCKFLSGKANAAKGVHWIFGVKKSVGNWITDKVTKVRDANSKVRYM